MELRVHAIPTVLLAPAILAKVGEAKITGSVVDEAKAIGHRALLIVLEFLIAEGFLHLLPQPNSEGGHNSFIIILDSSWTLGDDALEDVLLLQAMIRVLMQTLQTDLVVVAGE